MTFTSYAQNFEDVLLNRVLGDVDAGNYIDVGAADPVLDSVTKAFYDLGWSGINIDPLATNVARLSAQRPRDINLQLAVGAQEGRMTFHVVEDYLELSTMVPAVAGRYADAGRAVTEETVDVRTLASICDEHVTGPIHFLKIDVEGAEGAVLAGADFSRTRPWVILVESVTFGAEDSSEPEWDAHLIAADYEFAYFDGLNRFYVAAEKAADLLPAFAVPVNTRDDFTVALEERSEVSLSRISEILGMESRVDAHEMIERAGALFADRVRFEHEATSNAELLESALRELAEVRTTAAKIEEVQRQQSFERERHIAWLAMERAQLTTEVNDLRAETQDLKHRLHLAVLRSAELLSSSSWRVALPLRAARHPAPYLRKFLGR